jgi:DNA-binding CsgD family transcriptional regulator
VQKVQNVCDLARTGLSSAEIAEQLAISRDEVYSILHRYGSMDLARLRLFSKTRLIKEERAQRKAKRKIEILKLAVDVRKLCAKGYNMLEVARRLGIERTLLYYRLRKAETLYPGRFPPGTLVTEKRSRYSAPLEGLKI